GGVGEVAGHVRGAARGGEPDDAVALAHPVAVARPGGGVVPDVRGGAHDGGGPAREVRRADAVPQAGGGEPPGGAPPAAPAARADLVEVARPGGGVVLAVLGGAHDGGAPAREVRRDDAVLQAEGGEQLGGVADAGASARAGADVVNRAAGADPLRGDVDEPRERGQRGGHGVGDELVLRVDEAEQLEGVDDVEVDGAGVALLGGRVDGDAPAGALS